VSLDRQSAPPAASLITATLLPVRRSLAIAAALGACFVLTAFTARSTSGRTDLPVARTAAAAGTASPLFTGPLDTALVDVSPFTSPEAPLNFRRVRAAGARAVRLIVFWRFVAPEGSSRIKPPGFDANDPASSDYHWDGIDRQVTLALQNGLQPIVGIQNAPDWAERSREGVPGTRTPDPAELAAFARAAARRYSGTFQGLPRVRYWQAWNEPNLSIFMTPQSADHYRRMVNAFAEAVHGVRRDNLVVAGGLAPFGYQGVAVAPFEFMRDLLCMSAGRSPRPTCNDRISFDVWSHHPYTTGGPTRKAQNPDDASLGDLPEMRRLLEAAVRAGHVTSRVKPRFWVTEFSWDSSPPDPIAVPAQLHARWVSEGLYRMWQSGVTLVTWFSLRDDLLAESEFQSGLYIRDGQSYAAAKPKLSLRAFRFPFVAFSARGNVSVWGRTPGGRPGGVLVERRSGRGWALVGRLAANRYGIFAQRFRGGFAGPLRARLASGRDTSVPFTLKRPREIQVWPFGCGGILPCR
jgi:hypothetical protein